MRGIAEYGVDAALHHDERWANDVITEQLTPLRTE